MAKKKSSRARRNPARSRTRTQTRTPRAEAGGGRALDAVTLLKADHQAVKQLFQQFEAARSPDKKQQLASRVCKMLIVHTKIEEEIFYPAFLQATGDEDIHHEAEVEHDGAKRLIADIEASGPDDDYYEAKVHVLSEMIKHHVNEEEKRDGMFAKAKRSKMDLEALGQQMAARKSQLSSEESSADQTR